jgi:predicted CoA-binding protein
MAEKSVAQKLMIKQGRSVLLVNPPAGYDALLGELPAGVIVLTEPSAPADIVQVFVADRRELEEQLPKLKPLVKPKGMLWVTYHKGTSRIKTDIHRDTIAAYARSLGMEGVAMIAIDADWSALRLKIV